MPGITRVNLLYNMPPQPERPARDGKPACPAKPARPGRLAVAKSAFYDNFVWHSDEDPYVPGTDVPRLKLLHLASNATAAFNDEIEALEEGLRRWRDAGHPKPDQQNTVSKKAKQTGAETTGAGAPGGVGADAHPGGAARHHRQGEGQ